ncbi:3-carboxy-cis,cis-muconate cycloisomerase [Streptomyces armeniacus]|uniref:3-carboxy-cis,cis-muconate cycloisomerase n=1 Tax=Streptomyces armeniacus TaxID=83291 RepID=A0A345XI96_9ACTN|nr:3-carboxy-cis,cis-muconate cycloisomerase [Streptomyces armeniacus]AXK31362.1 3-carboxy-cis,cis-muconate cycloisomerase [Streptomyces armeniacus]
MRTDTSAEADADADTGAGRADTGADADAGLLAPCRAGTAVETATGDRAFLQSMLDAEAALTRAQSALGQAPEEAAKAVTAAARAEAYDVRDLALRARAAGNPVVPLLDGLRAAVDRTAPGAGAYVHRGATSQDILDTALMLVADRALRLTAAELARATEALARLAAEHRDTPVAGRTLTQHAVPTTFGLKAAGWRALLLDAYDRLAAVLDGGLPVQLGGAAGTLAAFGAHAEEAGTGAGTVLPLVARFAAETGLSEPALPWHTLRTPVADLAGALAFTCGALGKLAADVLVLSRTELREVAEADGGPSSAMPQKANPVRAALIASAARQAPALAATLYGSLAAEDERPAGAWHAEWQPLRELLRLTGGAAGQAAELTAGLRVFPARMAGNLRRTGGLIVTERVAAALAPHLGRARATEVLSAAARHVTEEGTPLYDVLAAEPDVTAALSDARLRELTDPAGYVGSAPELTDRALRRAPRTVRSAPGADQEAGR